MTAIRELDVNWRHQTESLIQPKCEQEVPVRYAARAEMIPKSRSFAALRMTKLGWMTKLGAERVGLGRQVSVRLARGRGARREQ